MNRPVRHNPSAKKGSDLKLIAKVTLIVVAVGVALAVLVFGTCLLLFTL